jgi:glycosyltransferase involved in cell wall biosynthesis
MPIQDNAGQDWALQRASAQATLTKPKILMAGFLRGTPTIAGLLYFGKEVLPHLERRFGPSGFEVHVVGSGTLRPEIDEVLRRPSVIIRGFVADIAAEFRSATVLATPTPFALGARTRIAEAFSYGCCVVAHAAEQAGMPELVNEKTALLGNSGLEIAQQITRALTEAPLRQRLERSARLVFERCFDQKVSATKLVEKMEAVAGSLNLSSLRFRESMR